MAPTRFKLTLSKLDFCSLVDNPAQSVATTLLIKRAGDADEVTATARLVKTSDELGLAFFWAFQATTADGQPYVDYQGDNVQADDAMLKACADFMLNGGGVDQQHDGVDGAGKIVFAMPMTKELATAYGLGDVKASGFMVAIKPTPDVLAKLKAKELNGVSIAGRGVREPLEKSDELAAHRAELEKQAAKALADQAYAAGVVKSSHAWLDEMVVKHGYEFARGQAETNRESVGKWGATWLAAHPDPATIEKSLADDPIEVLKSEQRFDTFMKSAIGNVEKSLADFNTARDAFVKVNPKREFLDTDEARKLYAKYDTARRAAVSGNIADIDRVYTAKSAALTTELEKEVEAFAVLHALDVDKARAQLAKSSPTFAKKYEQQSELLQERGVATSKASVMAQRWHEKQASASRDAEAAKAEQARLAKMTPAQRKYEAYSADLAKASGGRMSPQAAMGDALLKRDPTAVALADVLNEEFSNRIHRSA